MSSSSAYNRTSSYNRTYEKRIIEEGPQITRIVSPLHVSNIGSSLHPPISLTSLSSSGTGAGLITTYHQSDDYFYVQIDLSQFKPEDLKVSVVNSFIVIEAKHGEREDKKFNLPPSIPADAVTSNLTADGHLSVTASAPRHKEDGIERTIPIKLVASTVKPDVKPQSTTEQSSSQE
ncbi:unnamed protein product [Thelazia callipaeda]|uniref:SHSP domain-containing protein n=1 Tax=Thelazia callipaeda TaxID=103827 RepID=A0A0N5CW28_THECL|nr:unnamed protein product [Thelazia callipaeda]